jgi:pimeloyl-ACP methyl ester carboxylesterase
VAARAGAEIRSGQLAPEVEQIDVGGATLAVETVGSGPPVVLLHPGIADRRCWGSVVPLLDGHAKVITYDRRGHGDSNPSTEPFSHADDLIALLRGLDTGPAFIVGNSMGGGVAIDVALMEPELVSGLLLVAPSVSGEPDLPDEGLDPESLRLDTAIGEALKNDDWEFANRLEAWLWLDGPAGPEGRVGDPARSLLLEMNEPLLANGGAFEDGDSGFDAWSRLGDITQPTTVSWGDLDIPEIIELCETLVETVPGAKQHIFESTAHVPYLERPEDFAALVRDTAGRISRP